MKKGYRRVPLQRRAILGGRDSTLGRTSQNIKLLPYVSSHFHEGCSFLQFSVPSAIQGFKNSLIFFLPFATRRIHRMLSARRIIVGLRTTTTKVRCLSSSPLAKETGRHEIWRENQSSDHDNEPRYVRSDPSSFVWHFFSYKFHCIRLSSYVSSHPVSYPSF